MIGRVYGFRQADPSLCFLCRVEDGAAPGIAAWNFRFGRVSQTVWALRSKKVEQMAQRWQFRGAPEFAHRWRFCRRKNPGELYQEDVQRSYMHRGRRLEQEKSMADFSFLVRQIRRERILLDFSFLSREMDQAAFLEEFAFLLRELRRQRDEWGFSFLPRESQRPEAAVSFAFLPREAARTQSDIVFSFLHRETGKTQSDFVFSFLEREMGAADGTVDFSFLVRQMGADEAMETFSFLVRAILPPPATVNFSFLIRRLTADAGGTKLERAIQSGMQEEKRRELTGETNRTAVRQGIELWSASRRFQAESPQAGAKRNPYCALACEIQNPLIREKKEREGRGLLRWLRTLKNVNFKTGIHLLRAAEHSLRAAGQESKADRVRQWDAEMEEKQVLAEQADKSAARRETETKLSPQWRRKPLRLETQLSGQRKAVKNRAKTGEPVRAHRRTDQAMWMTDGCTRVYRPAQRKAETASGSKPLQKVAENQKGSSGFMGVKQNNELQRPLPLTALHSPGRKIRSAQGERLFVRPARRRLKCAEDEKLAVRRKPDGIDSLRPEQKLENKGGRPCLPADAPALLGQWIKRTVETMYGLGAQKQKAHQAALPGKALAERSGKQPMDQQTPEIAERREQHTAKEEELVLKGAPNESLAEIAAVMGRRILPVTFEDPRELVLFRRFWTICQSGRTDRMVIPDLDYDYEGEPLVFDQPEQHNKNWDSVFPNTFSQRVDRHPVPFGADLGMGELPVDVGVLVDMLNLYILMWFRCVRAFWGWTGTQAVLGMTANLHEYLTLETSRREQDRAGLRADYDRTFRWIRWEAEQMALRARNDMELNGNHYVGLLLEELTAYLLDHHADAVPLFRDVSKMDEWRTLFGRELENDISWVLDKVKGIRHRTIGGHK